MVRHVVVAGAAIAAAALCVVGSTAVMRANEAHEVKLTYLTFSGSVKVPGATLPAGTYRFQLATATSTSVMRVLSQDSRQVYATFFTKRGAPMMNIVNKPVVLFFEHVANSPDVIMGSIYADEAYPYVYEYGRHENPGKRAAASSSSPDLLARTYQFPCVQGQMICR